MNNIEKIKCRMQELEIRIKETKDILVEIPKEIYKGQIDALKLHLECMNINV